MRSFTCALIASLALTVAGNAVAQNRAPVQPTPAPALQLNTPNAAKPDFVILHASAVGGKNDVFMVQVKNDGIVNSPAAHLRSGNKTGTNGKALTPIPPIKAGQFIWVKVELNKAARPGDRILVEADYNKAVAETKENNNNNYAFNW